MKPLNFWGAVCTTLLLCAPLSANQAVEWAPNARENARLPRFTRAELYAVLDRYLAALKAQDPITRRLGAAGAQHREQRRPDGGRRPLADDHGRWAATTCALRTRSWARWAYFGTVTETEETAAFTLRLKVVDEQVAEVETLVVRQLDSGIKFEGQKFEHKPAMNEILPPAQRLPRPRMISLADGYFDTLQLNDGTLFTKFHANCKRVENGVQTTNNPNFAVVPVSRLGCEEQFRLGNYRYDTRLRARRFPLVDEERGLVLAAGFIDHSGVLA